MTLTDADRKVFDALARAMGMAVADESRFRLAAVFMVVCDRDGGVAVHARAPNIGALEIGQAALRDAIAQFDDGEHAPTQAPRLDS
jgi:hypothetical protein